MSSITIVFGSWMIPTIITFIGLYWALFIVKDGGGYMSGISNIFALVPALAISCVSWMIWGFCK
jgi:hypothetical protein